MTKGLFLCLVSGSQTSRTASREQNSWWPFFGRFIIPWEGDVTQRRKVRDVDLCEGTLEAPETEMAEKLPRPPVGKSYLAGLLEAEGSRWF